MAYAAQFSALTDELVEVIASISPQVRMRTRPLTFIIHLVDDAAIKIGPTTKSAIV